MYLIISTFLPQFGILQQCYLPIIKVISTHNENYSSISNTVSVFTGLSGHGKIRYLFKADKLYMEIVGECQPFND